VLFDAGVGDVFNVSVAGNVVRCPFLITTHWTMDTQAYRTWHMNIVHTPLFYDSLSR
jgi:hypothetical protein